MRRIFPALLPAMALIETAAAAAAPSPPRQINLLNETRISAEASCAVVWDLLLHRETWLGGFIEKRTLSGTVEKAGEVSFVHTVYQGRSNDRFEEVVVASPERRYLLAMMVPSAGITTFSDYQLQAVRSGCDVAFSVKLTKLLGRNEKSEAEDLHWGTQQKIEKDLLDLKHAAERKAH